jgi:hypothetical protein
MVSLWTAEATGGVMTGGCGVRCLTAGHGRYRRLAPAHGQIVYITEHGERLAAIVPAAVATELERLSPAELAELLEDFADAAAAREARASIEGVRAA